jgi:hypothetical protein
MKTPRARLGCVALAAVSLGLVAPVAPVECRPRVASPADEGALAGRLRALGYVVHAEPRDRQGALLSTGHPRAVLAGLYACRDEPADWEAVASRPRAYGRDWRGCAVATPLRGRWVPPTADDVEDHLVAGPWLLFGDPAVLDEIGRALGVPR